MPEADPAVRCMACEFVWNSRAMVDGLRLMRGCPRCGGELRFRADDDTTPQPETVREVAPHRVLGLPRLPD